jgi:lysine-N-methylase
MAMEQERLHPNYAEQFHCIGSACDETCCQGWIVFVDKPTYERYRKTSDLKPLTDAHIEVNPLNSDALKYARIRLKKDGYCPFLTAEKLCCIHQRHGLEFLSTTCSRYPRASVRIDGELETALHLSCPEAARTVLLNPQLLPTAEGAPYSGLRLKSSHHVGKISLPAIVRKLRSFALELLRDRSYPLWQRLFLLGVVCRRAQELIATQQPTGIPHLLSQYAEMLLDGSLRPHLDGIPARPELQLSIVIQLIRRRYEIEQPRQDFAGIVAEFLLGIGHSPDAPLPGSAETYQHAYEAYEASFLRAHPAFLENYLVNYFFRTRFPFADSVLETSDVLSPLSSCLLMLLHYRLLDSLLAGVAARYGAEFDESQALRVVRSFSRSIEHNFRFADSCAMYLKSPELQQADGLAALLRN